MLDMPGILPRLVHILRVVNYGPNLAELINHNMAPQVPITSDILTFFSTTMGVSDWEHFDHLEQAVQRDPSSVQEDAGSPRSARSARCTYCAAVCPVLLLIPHFLIIIFLILCLGSFQRSCRQQRRRLVNPRGRGDQR